MRAESVAHRGMTVARQADQSMPPVSARVSRRVAPMSGATRRAGGTSPALRAPCPQRDGVRERSLRAWGSRRGGGQSAEWSFDNIDHELLLRAVRKHCSVSWALLIDRWLKAPTTIEGQRVERTRGTPQGGVVSPLLANLFLHYSMDLWMRRHMPGVQFCRYADDGVVHCRSEMQAQAVLEQLGERLRQCGLELHPEKTRIVYCQDINRKSQYSNVQFTFLGYTFRPRKSVDKYKRIYVNFSPAVSRDALKAMRQTVRGWHMQLKCDKSLSDLSSMFGPVLRGWANYYGRFYHTALGPLWRHVNAYLVRWMQNKYKSLARGVTRAARALARLAQRTPRAFVHWERGYVPAAL